MGPTEQAECHKILDMSYESFDFDTEGVTFFGS